MLQLRPSYHSSTAFLHLTENRHCMFVLGLFFGGQCCVHFCSELLLRKVWLIPEDEDVRLRWFFSPNSFCGLFTTRIRHKSKQQKFDRDAPPIITLYAQTRDKNNHLYYFTDPLQQRLCAPQCNTSESSSRVYGSFFYSFPCRC